MHGIFTYIWVIFRANVGKYSIHGSYGISKTGENWKKPGWLCEIMLPGLVKVSMTNWKIIMLLMLGKSTISMTIFSSKLSTFTRKSCCFLTDFHGWRSPMMSHFVHEKVLKQGWCRSVDPICCFEFYWDILCLPSKNAENLRNVAIYHLVN